MPKGRRRLPRPEVGLIVSPCGSQQQADQAEDSTADLAQCYEQSVNAFLNPENSTQEEDEVSEDRGDGFVMDPLAVTEPKPGSAASWPSLYPVLCKILRKHGTVDEEGQKAILVSQLKPLRRRHWHDTFDEASFAYRRKDGSSVRKVKHLLQALLGWRAQFMAWDGRSSCQMKDALEYELQLVPSKRHNDLLLREGAPLPRLGTGQDDDQLPEQ
eukprot:Skav211160  [mRNA]  locus=scaffold413:455622:456263:+ [translate_table: standard]